MTVDDPEGYDQGCTQCGLCCKVFGDRIIPTLMNLHDWMESGRTDILKFFWVCTCQGRFCGADSIQQEDLSAITAIELRDPDTGEYLASCPFLHRSGKNRYICSIHTTKPDMCCNYMPWVWGETYFPKCPALKDSDKLACSVRIRSENVSGTGGPGSELC